MLKKIPVAQLTLGMHLQAFCGAWLDHPFWRTKFVLTDPNDLTLILESQITEVWIDIAKGCDVATPSADAVTVEMPGGTLRVEVGERDELTLTGDVALSFSGCIPSSDTRPR